MCVNKIYLYSHNQNAVIEPHGCSSYDIYTSQRKYIHTKHYGLYMEYIGNSASPHPLLHKQNRNKSILNRDVRTTPLPEPTAEIIYIKRQNERKKDRANNTNNWKMYLQINRTPHIVQYALLLSSINIQYIERSHIYTIIGPHTSHTPGTIAKRKQSSYHYPNIVYL